MFDKNTGQKEVFDRLGFPLVEDLLQGKNGENRAPSSLYISLPFTVQIVKPGCVSFANTKAPNCGAVVKEL